MADITTTASSQEANAYLTSFLNKTLHLHISDGRTFVGQMKCTDNERNIILAMTHEYRQPSQADVDRVFEGAGEGSAVGRMNQVTKKRFVGLVVVPGRVITRIEVEG